MPTPRPAPERRHPPIPAAQDAAALNGRPVGQKDRTPGPADLLDAIASAAHAERTAADPDLAEALVALGLTQETAMPDPSIPTHDLIPHLAAFMREHGISGLFLECDPKGSVSGEVVLRRESLHTPAVEGFGRRDHTYLRTTSDRDLHTVHVSRSGFTAELDVQLAVPAAKPETAEAAA